MRGSRLIPEAQRLCSEPPPLRSGLAVGGSDLLGGRLHCSHELRELALVQASACSHARAEVKPEGPNRTDRIAYVVETQPARKEDGHS